METKSLSELMKDDDIFFQVEIKIGPFKLMNQIGTGKFSTVYLGIHEETGQKVAIKQIKKSEINTNILLAKEINIQKILFHPYLTQLYCVIEKPENIYLISEYCSKGDIITNLIDRGNFKEDFACKIFQQILSSLEYLHKNNITHRDIKPENILLTENYDAKLTDFGLSKYYKENQLLSTFCGSPIYASPEMLEGKKYNGTKIDVWGLGISLYTMVCGELPFIIEDENDIKTLINNIINGNYSVPDFLSNECKDLIKKMLEINPDKRISLEEIKKHKWVNMFNFDYMKSPGVLLHEYFIPVDIYLIKDILGNNESKIEKLIEDLLENKHNENTIKYYLKNKVKVNKGEKSVGDLRPNSELFLNYINSDKSKKNYWGNDIKKITNYYLKQISDLFNKTKEKNNNGNIELFRKKNLEKFNSYIGPLIFIHNIIDGIITKVILIKNKSSNLNNYSISSTAKMEIKNKINKISNIIISKENNIHIKNDNVKNNKNDLSINKANNIELISTNNFNKNRSMSYKMNNNMNSNRNNINNNKIPKKKNRSNSDIKHLQINLIENEIIINDLNIKENLNNEIQLNKNFGQNYNFDINKDCFIKLDSNNKAIKNRKKDKNNYNKISNSKIQNKSCDMSTEKIIINKYFQKSIDERENKANILMNNYKKFNINKNINTFIKTSVNNKKENTSTLFSFNSPPKDSKKNTGIKFLNNNISFTRFDVIPKNNYFPVDINYTNKMIQLSKYNNLSTKDININNNKKDKNKTKLLNLISPKMSNKNEIIKINSANKKRMKNTKEENLVIKSTLPLEEIRQIIKKIVGNNVVENYEERNVKFICKTRIGKDDLIFHLELISMNFETKIFGGKLIQGETKTYKEILLKLKEKLS